METKLEPGNVERISLCKSVYNEPLGALPAPARVVSQLPMTIPARASMAVTVAVNVTDCPSAAEAVEALSAVRVGRALNRARCSRRPTWGRNRTRDGSHTRGGRQ